MEIRTDGGSAPRSPSITGNTRAFSSASDTGAAPGRVDSPPTSIQFAPSSAIRAPAATAAATLAYLPPSEKESGVQFRTPTIRQLTGPDLQRIGAEALLSSGLVGDRARRGEDAGTRLLGGLRLARAHRRRRQLPIQLLAGEDLVNLGAVDGLVLQQRLRERLQLVDVVDDDLLRALVVGGDNLADLAVGLDRRLLAVFLDGIAEVAAQEHLALALAEVQRPKLFGHAPVTHH